MTSAIAHRHAANYERESKQKTLSADELLALLTGIVADGHGALPIVLMDCERGDGLTHARPISGCFVSEPYDGEVVWLL